METVKVHLKLRQKCPKNSMPFLGIVVDGYQYKPYEITEAHAVALEKDKGVIHWISCKELEESKADASEEEESEEPTEEELEALRIAEENKGKEEAENNPASEGAPEGSQEKGPELIDEKKIIEDNLHLADERKEYDALVAKGELNKKEKARLAELKAILKIEE